MRGETLPPHPPAQRTERARARAGGPARRSPPRGILGIPPAEPQGA